MDKWTELDEIEYQRLKKLSRITFWLGWCGGHRFYEKKIGTGILYLCTFGLFAVGWLVDVARIEFKCQKLRDKKNYVERVNSAMNKIHRTRGMTAEEAKRELAKKYCPSCGSDNCHAFVEDKVIRQGKTKMQTSVNLNPLKPFTVFNHKEKVVREPWTMQVSKFVCDDCGKIFQ